MTERVIATYEPKPRRAKKRYFVEWFSKLHNEWVTEGNPFRSRGRAKRHAKRENEEYGWMTRVVEVIDE